MEGAPEGDEVHHAPAVGEGLQGPEVLVCPLGQTAVQGSGAPVPAGYRGPQFAPAGDKNRTHVQVRGEGNRKNRTHVQVRWEGNRKRSNSRTGERGG